MSDVMLRVEERNAFKDCRQGKAFVPEAISSAPRLTGMPRSQYRFNSVRSCSRNAPGGVSAMTEQRLAAARDPATSAGFSISSQVLPGLMAALDTLAIWSVAVISFAAVVGGYPD